MYKIEIISRLREVTGIQNVGLPKDVGATINNFVLTIKIEKPCCNMQGNNSSFEGWALTLRRWLSNRVVQEVLLDWNSLDLSLDSVDNSRLHYNRFLYRVYMFLQMYPDWFRLSEGKREEVNSFISWLKNKNCLLNRPLQDKATDCSDKQNERGVESLFASKKNSYLLKERTGITYLNSQLPVGLFKEKVKAKNAVFTRGLSAIDLWGINASTLCIYELKYQNRMIGIISELFFYLMILNEACCKNDSWFNFEEKAFKSNARGIDKLTMCKFAKMHGYFLVDSLHPLIDNEVVTLLNEGLCRIGNIKASILLYDYNGGDLKWQA